MKSPFHRSNKLRPTLTMNWVVIAIVCSVLALTEAKANLSNDISVPSSTPNLDSDLRKALLRALSELENEDATEGRSGSSTERSKDRFIERASASALSIITKDEHVTEAQVTTTAKPIVVIQKSSVFQATTPEPEDFVTSATSSFVNSNINLNAVTINDKRFTPGVKSVSITPKPETTTAITTTTEESEAKVEDVQFFSAPLVAAFTVHQDAQGLPKKVEPIFKTPPTKPQKKEHVKAQISFHEKQRALEEQVFNLQQQQRYQQEYLLQQQQLLIQQQRLLAEKQRQQQNSQPFHPINNQQPNQVQNEVQSFASTQQLPNQFQANKFRPENTVVSLQPSITYTQTSQLPLNAQILPIRNAVDFHTIPTYQHLNSQPQQQQSFNSFQTFPQRQSNRVFRREPATGNLGFNHQFQQQQFPQQPQQTQNRFFRSNAETYHPNVNQQLNTLLYQSGISRNVRQNEDLNIVSKILSYNVGRQNF